MIRRGKSTEPSAVRAVAHLVGIGVLEIRSMAGSREVLAVGKDADPGSPQDTDFLARIQMIADICQDFTGPFLEEDESLREQMAADALTWRWSASIPEARRWLVSRITQLGPEYRSLLE